MTKSGHTYTPPETKEAETRFRQEFEKAVGDDFTPFEGPLDVRWEFANDNVRVTIHSTVDYSQRKLRGDLDNYCKLVSDALNDVAYLDDRQIVSFQAVKL